jgi:hypothetical protein
MILLCTSAWANDIFITQSGDNFDLHIVQKGKNNQIKGTSGNTSAQVSGANTILDINQGVEGDNLLQLNVDGTSNKVIVGQEKFYSTTGIFGNDTNSYGNHTATVDITGDNNEVQIVQRNNNTSSAGHTSSAIITNGNGNTIHTLQTGTGGSNGHNSYVHVNDGRDGNTVDVFQNSDTADHKAVVSVYSDNNNIEIDQTGTVQNKSYVLFSHNSSGPTDFSLTQNGGDTYGNPDTGSYATVTCGNVGGCTVTVTQN